MSCSSRWPPSGGQRVRIALIGVISQAGLLVLDEPSNHLDASGRHWLMAQLAAWRGGLILVSHDRRLLDSVQRIVELPPSWVQVFGGNYAAYPQQRSVAAASTRHRLPGRTAPPRTATPAARTRHHHPPRSRIAQAGADRQRLALRAGHHHERPRQRPWARATAHQACKTELNAQVREAHARVIPNEPVLIPLPGTAVPNSRQAWWRRSCRGYPGKRRAASST